MHNILSFLELKVYAATAVGASPISGVEVTSVASLVNIITNVLIIVGVAITVTMFIISVIRGGAKALVYVIIGMIGLLIVYGIRTILLNLLGASQDIVTNY